MKIGYAAAALLLFAVLPARGVELERGEWRRVGDSFACTVGAPRPLAPGEVTPEAMLLACLHMGPFVIGGAAARTLEATLGPPHRTLPQPKETKALVWFLGEPGHYPYFIATVRNDKIAALQVTGTAHPKAYSFNHVNLGDSTETLAKYFGPAFQVGKSDLPDTDVWHYGPWPFSFEVKAGQVTSIRIADPAP